MKLGGRCRTAFWIGAALSLVSGCSKTPPISSPWKPATVAWSESCAPGECETLAEKLVAHTGGETVAIQINPKVDDAIAQFGDCLEQVMTCFRTAGGDAGACVRDATACPATCREKYDARLAESDGGVDALFDALEQVFLVEGAPCRPERP